MTGGLLNRLTDAAARRGTRPRGRVDAGRRGVPAPVGRGRIRGRARLGAIPGSRGRTLRIGGRRSHSARRIHRGGRRLLRGDVARRDPTDTHTRRPTGDRRRIASWPAPAAHAPPAPPRPADRPSSPAPAAHAPPAAPAPAADQPSSPAPAAHAPPAPPRPAIGSFFACPGGTCSAGAPAPGGSAFFACPGGTCAAGAPTHRRIGSFFACPGGTRSAARADGPRPAGSPSSPAPAAPRPTHAPTVLGGRRRIRLLRLPRRYPVRPTLRRPFVLRRGSGVRRRALSRSVRRRRSPWHPRRGPSRRSRCQDPRPCSGRSPWPAVGSREVLARPAAGVRRAGGRTGVAAGRAGRDSNRSFPLPLADASSEPPPDPCLDGVPVVAAEVSPADPLPFDDDGPRAARAGAAHIRALNSSAAITKAARPTKDPRARSRRRPRGRDASAEPIAVSNCSLGRSLSARGPRPPTLRSRQLRKQSRFVPLRSVALDLGARPWFRLGDAARNAAGSSPHHGRRPPGRSIGTAA